MEIYEMMEIEKALEYLELLGESYDIIEYCNSNLVSIGMYSKSGVLLLRI